MRVPRDVRRKVRIAIDSPFETEWSLQGFGMLRHYLTEDKSWRLHIWDDNYRVPGAAMTHNHLWNLESSVLSGALVNRKYRVSTELWKEFRSSPTHQEMRVVAGLTVRSDRISKAVILVPEVSIPYVARTKQNVYRQGWNEVHCTDALNGTITIVHREPVDGAHDHACVYVEHDKELIGTAPRNAKTDEVITILGRATDRMWLHGGLHWP